MKLFLCTISAIFITTTAGAMQPSARTMEPIELELEIQNLKTYIETATQRFNQMAGSEKTSFIQQSAKILTSLWKKLHECVRQGAELNFIKQSTILFDTALTLKQCISTSNLDETFTNAMRQKVNRTIYHKRSSAG